MSNEQEQSAQRRSKLEEITELGVPAYPNRFDRTDAISDIVTRYGATPGEALEAARPVVAVSGRILGLRSFVKANFLALSDGLARLQVYVREDSTDAQSFQIFKRLDLGDQIGVRGRVFRTKTNELTVWAESITFL